MSDSNTDSSKEKSKYDSDKLFSLDENSLDENKEMQGSDELGHFNSQISSSEEQSLHSSSITRSEMIKAIRELQFSIESSPDRAFAKNLSDAVLERLPGILKKFALASGKSERQFSKQVLDKFCASMKNRELGGKQLSTISSSLLDIHSLNCFVKRNLELLNLSYKYSVSDIFSEISSKGDIINSDKSESLAIKMRLIALRNIQDKYQAEFIENDTNVETICSEIDTFIQHLKSQFDLDLSLDCLLATKRYCNLAKFSHKDNDQDNSAIIKILEKAIDNIPLAICINESDRFLAENQNFDDRFKLIDKLEESSVSKGTDKNTIIKDTEEDNHFCKKSLSRKPFKTIGCAFGCAFAILGGLFTQTSFLSVHQADIEDEKNISTSRVLSKSRKSGNTSIYDTDTPTMIKVEARWSDKGENFNKEEATLAIDDSLVSHGIITGGKVKLTNLYNQETTIAQVKAEIHQEPHQVIISKSAAQALNMVEDGVAKLIIEPVSRTRRNYQYQLSNAES